MTTPVAYSGEAELAGIDDTAGFGSRLAAQGLGDYHMGQVDDAAALGADEMDVGFGVAVEPLNAIHSTQAGNLALLLKQGQVSVDRTEGDVREFRLEAGVDPISRRVDVSPPDAGQDCIPFSEMLRCLLHRHLLFKNDSHLHPYNSI